MPKGKGTASESGSGGKDNVLWNEEMDQLLLTALIEEANKGNRNDGAWTTEAYSNIIETLRSAIGPAITKKHIKNRMKTLKTHFAEVYDWFHCLSGFAWNPITRKLEAEDEVWDELIRAKPQAVRWRKMQIKHYDMLTELFAADRAKGKRSRTAKEMLQQWEKDNIDLNDSIEDVEGHEADISMVDDQVSPPDFDAFSPQAGHSNQSSSTSASRGIKRKRKMVEVMHTQCDRMNEGIMSFVEALKESNSLADKMNQVVEGQVEIAEKQLTLMQQTRPRHYSESDVWALLEELRGSRSVPHEML